MKEVLEKLQAMFGQEAVVSLEMNGHIHGIHVAKFILSHAQFLSWMTEPRVPFDEQGLHLVGFTPEPLYDLVGDSVLLMRHWKVVVKFW